MKVFVVNGGGDTGGGKTHLVTLLPELRKLGLDAQMVCFAEGMLSEETRAAGTPTRVLGIGVMLSPRLLLQLVELFRSERPEVVHTHGARANLYGRVAAKLVGVPRIVTTMHSHTDLDYSSRWKNLLFSTIDRSTRPLADRYIAVSHELGRALVQGGIPSRKLAVVHNGIYEPATACRDLRSEFGIEGPIICAVGRLVGVKRFDLLLSAFQRVLATGKQATLLLVGDGPLEDELRSMASELGIAASVRFLGYRQDARQLMQASDAFVMSSDIEGLPIVMLEAMSAGVPIVVTAVGGIPEVVTDKVNGLLVERGDAPALANGIIDILSDSKSALERAASAREWFLQNASARAMAEKTAAVYRQEEVKR